MSLKVLCVSFINLLVALAVNSANASPYKDENLLLRSIEAYKEKKFYKSDYLIAKYLGDANANRLNAIDAIQKRESKPKPTSFIDGDYSRETLQFFFNRTLNQWGSQKNDKEDNILVKINSNGNYYISVWGKPYIETWYIIAKGKKNQIAYTVGMHNAKIRIGKLHKNDRLLKPCDTFDINGPIQYFYEPDFRDINNNGKKELLLRYNVTVADGYIQVLDIFVPRVKDNYCYLSHKKSYYGRNGFAYFKNGKIIVSKQTSKEREGILGASLQTETRYSTDGNIINEKVVPNFLKTSNIAIIAPYFNRIENDDYDKYQAYLMVCLKGKKKTNKNCEELFDTRGPFKTKDECIDRIFEMKNDLPKYKPDYYSHGYLCEHEKQKNKEFSKIGN